MSFQNGYSAVPIPDGVFLNNANKVFFSANASGLQARANDSVTQANAAGGFNGSGTGNAGYISFNGMDGALANTFI